MTAAGNTASGAADLPAGFTTAGIKTDSGVEGTAYGFGYNANSVSSTSSVAGTLQGPFLNSASGSATHTGTHASGKKVSAVSGSGGLAAAGQVPIAGGSGALTAGQSGSTASTFYGNNVATASQGGTASASGFLGRKLLWGPAVSGSVALGKSKSYGTVGLGTMTAAGNTASGAADLPAGFTTAGIKTDSGVE